MSGQLSFFSAEALPPTVYDVEGLLAGPGQVVRRGDSAPVSVVGAEDLRPGAARAPPVRRCPRGPVAGGLRDPVPTRPAAVDSGAGRSRRLRQSPLSLTEEQRVHGE